MDNYCEGESIFFLPFPGQGNQKFREGLVKVLEGFHLLKLNALVHDSLDRL